MSDATQATSHDTIGAVSDASFREQVLDAAGPILLKIEADWCGPCQAMKPMIAEIATEYAGKLKVATLDVDQNNRTAYQLGVRSVPTVVLFKDGQVVAQKVGLPRKSDLTALIERSLS
jgi:thioredoxin